LTLEVKTFVTAPAGPVPRSGSRRFAVAATVAARAGDLEPEALEVGGREARS
jgi:hypothetical protein